MTFETTKAERAALDLLPYRLQSAAVKCVLNNKGALNEIRLRLGRYLSVTSRGKNHICQVRCTKEDIDDVIRRLCGNSLYSHADTLREGYISYDCGIRAGVCGRAVAERGRINAVTDITSVNIRVPHRVKGAADGAYRLLEDRGFSSGMLVYSRAGVGKTTLLRELVAKLAASYRVSVVDSRCEIMAGVEESVMADVLSAYPRAKGIEIAVRTMSPEFLVCDEIASNEDVAAISAAVGAGVNIIATAHAGSFDELMHREQMRTLIDRRAFDVYLGLLSRDEAGTGYVHEVSFIESLGAEHENAVKI